MDGPSRASGGMMMLTREPSGSRASHSGDVSSTRRPTRLTMRVQMLMTWALSRKRHVGELQLALALDVDLLRPVDHDVADRLVGEQNLQRSEPEHVVEQRRDQVPLLGAVELQLFFRQDLADDFADLLGQFLRRQGDRLADVDPVQQDRLDPLLGLLDDRPVGGSGSGRRRDAPALDDAFRLAQDQVGQDGDDIAPVGIRQLDPVALARLFDGVDDPDGEIGAGQAQRLAVVDLLTNDRRQSAGDGLDALVGAWSRQGDPGRGVAAGLSG